MVMSEVEEIEKPRILPASEVLPDPGHEELLTISARSALSGEIVATVRLSPGSSCLQLGRSIACELQRSEFPKVLFQGRSLVATDTLSSAGLSSGHVVDVVWLSWPLVLTASDDRTAQLWSSSVDGAGCRYNLQHFREVRHAALSNDGRLSLTGGIDGIVTIWGSEGTSLTSAANLGAICAVGFAGSTPLALTSKSLRKELWNIETGECIGSFNGHSSGFYSATLSTDGRLALLGYWDGIAEVWKTEPSECTQLLEVPGGIPVCSTALSANGLLMLRGTRTGLAEAWSIETSKCVRRFPGHNCAVRAVAFSTKADYALTGAEDRVAKLWSLDTGDCLREFCGHAGYIYAAAFSADDHLVVTGSADGTAKIWDAESSDCLRALQGHVGPVRAIALALTSA